MNLDVTQSVIQTALVNFLAGVLPAGIEVFEGQDNRVPEPTAQDFVIFTVMSRERFSTNVRKYFDCAFTASIAGMLMTLDTVSLGQLAVGATVFGSGVAANTTIVELQSGTGGPGSVYVVNPAQTVPDQSLAAGSATVAQSTQLTFQIDVHGPNSSDNAQIISTLFRDDLGVQLFHNVNENVTPLYADSPRQSPFINAESQYEYRWTIDAMVQATQTVLGVPQEFFDVVDVTFVPQG